MSDKQPQVLIVEDTPDVRSFLIQLLTRSGYRVRAVENGREAIAAVQAQRPDIILLDLSMPQFDGWQTLSALRLLPNGASLVVLAVTAHAMLHDRERAIRHGFNGYVSKPIDLSALLDMMQRLVTQLR